MRVFLDANVPGIQLLSVGVLFDNTIFSYVPQSLAASGTPSYILYFNAGGMPAMITQLIAQQDPWQLWPGLVPPGQSQVNVNWADSTFVGTVATALGIKIAGIRLQVIAQGDTEGEVVLSSTAGGNVLQVAGVVQPLPVTGSFTVYTPEPTTALLVGMGLLGLGIAGRRRA